MTLYARDGDWWSAGVWMGLFKRMLGVKHVKAHSMLNILIKQGQLVRHPAKSLYRLRLDHG